MHVHSPGIGGRRSEEVGILTVDGEILRAEDAGPKSAADALRDDVGVGEPQNAVRVVAREGHCL